MVVTRSNAETQDNARIELKSIVMSQWPKAETRNRQDNTVQLSPELVAMLDKRQREWGTSTAERQ